MGKFERNKPNSLCLDFSQSQLPSFGKEHFQFAKCWEDGEGERDGTTAASKLLRLTRPVWDAQPEDCVSLVSQNHRITEL